MEPNLINERIMLARAHPRLMNQNTVDFPSVFEEQLAAEKKAMTLKQENTAQLNQQEIAAPQKKLIRVGTLSKENPTVSNILIKNPEFKKDCWKIIHDTVNKDKPYTSIMDGTDIYMDPETRELLWGDMVPETTSEKAVATISSAPILMEPVPTVIQPIIEKQIPEQTTYTFSEKLVDAVTPYLGQDYNNIDCYELIVNGLQKMGIKYQGNGGLGHKLIQMAIERGLPINAYFNGEGLIKASGSNVYSKSVLNVTEPEKQAKEIIDELSPILEKGLILSFSTPTKGHTGIISKKDDTWTFINSGDMDNIIEKTSYEKGVGEENLVKEIINWFKLAESRNENLRISVGKLNEDKLSAYLEKPSKIIRNV